MQDAIENTSERKEAQANGGGRSTGRDTAGGDGGGWRDKKFHPVWTKKGAPRSEPLGVPGFSLVGGEGWKRVRKVYWRCGSFYARVLDPITERECWRRSKDGTPQGAIAEVEDGEGARTLAQQQRYHDALESTKSRREGWTIGDVLKAYPDAAAKHRAATGEPAEATVSSYMSRARRVFRGHEDDLASRAPDLLLDYAVEHNRRNGGGDPTETAASTAQQVRSLFSPWALAAYERAGMPRLDLRWHAIARPEFQFRLQPQELRDRTIAAGKEELANGSELGIAFLLEFFCAMSAADAIRARWDWLGPDDVVRYKRHKTGKDAWPKLAPEVAARWRELEREAARASLQDGRRPRELVMPQESITRREEFLVRKEIPDWMHGLGWTTKKLGHELRKLMCSIWFTHVGAEWTQAWSGDSLAVLQKHYARLLPERAPAAPSV